MPDLARFANRFRFLVLLRGLLLLGAALEAVAALLLTTAPGKLATLMGLPAPEVLLPIHLLALALLLLAILAWEAARDPRRYSAIVRTAVAGHLLAAAVLSLAAFRGPGATSLAWLAAVNGVLGVALAGTWWSVRA